MANVVNILVKGKDQASRVFKQIERQAKGVERSLDQARRSFQRLENTMNNAPDVDIDTKQATAQIKALKAQLDALERDDVEIKVRTNTNYLLASIAAVGPMLSPVLASATAGVIALGTAFATAGIGAVAFAAVAVPALKRVFNETKNLTKKEREAQKALKGFQSFWKKFAASFSDPVLDIFIKSLGTLETALTKLKPTFAASIDAVADLMDGFDKAVRSSEMQKFFDWLGKNVGPTMRSFGVIFGNVMQGVMNLMMAFGPLSKDMMTGLEGLTKRFADWSAELSRSKGFQEFVKFVRDNGPTIISIIGQLFRLLKNLIEVLGPLGSKLLDLTDDLLEFTNNLIETNPELVAFAAAITASAGAFALLKKPFSWLVTGIGLLGKGFDKAGGAIKDFATKFGSLRSISIVAWVALAIAAIQRLYNKSKEFKDYVDTSFRGVFDTLKNTFKNLDFSPVTRAIDQLKGSFGNLLDALAPVARFIGTTLVDAFVTFSAFVNGLIQSLPSLAASFVNLLGVLASVASGFTSLMTLDFEGVKAAWKSAGDSMGAMFDNAVDAAVNFGKGVDAVFVAASQTVSNQSNSIKMSLGSIAGSAKQSGAAIGSGFSMSIAPGLTQASNKAATTSSSIKNTLGQVPGPAGTSGTQTGSKFHSGMKPGMDKSKGTADTTKNGITKALSGLSMSAAGWGSSLGNAFAAGLRGSLSLAVSAARSAASLISSILSSAKASTSSAKKGATTLSTRGIGWHAKGGLFNGPSIIGVGEAGKEAVIPLSGSNMRPFAQTIAKEMGGTKTSQPQQPQPVINIYEAQRTTDKEILAAWRRAAFLYG